MTVQPRYKYIIGFFLFCLACYFITGEIIQLISNTVANTDSIIRDIIVAMAVGIFSIIGYILLMTIISITIYFIAKRRNNIELKKAFSFNSIICLLVCLFMICYIIYQTS
jgi:hypothetical protein